MLIRIVTVIKNKYSLVTVRCDIMKASNKAIMVIMNKSNDYLLSRNIATIAVFYALPVIQLVITYQTVC